MDKEKFKDRDNQKDIQDKEDEKLTDEELDKVSGGGVGKGPVIKKGM